MIVAGCDQKKWSYRLCSVEEARKIYYSYMEVDFPADELRPFWGMERLFALDLYDAFSFYYEDRWVGYAFLVRGKTHILLDYYAIAAAERGQGYGSLALACLRQHYKEFSAILLETEDAEEEILLGEREKRQRRDRFYMKNGALRILVKEFVFGVHFQTWQIPLGEVSSDETCLHALRELYQSIVPKDLYEKHVFIYSTEEKQGSERVEDES